MRLTAIVLLCGAVISAQPAPDSIKLDNEFVRVLFLTDQPRTKTPLHRHEFNRVMIYLDPIELVLRYQDGQVDRQRWRKGQVAWSPGGRLHTGENLIDRTARVVEVELKKPPSGKPFQISKRDPMQVDAKNYIAFIYTDGWIEGGMSFEEGAIGHPLEPGRYEIRLMRDDGYMSLAVTPPFEVR